MQCESLQLIRRFGGDVVQEGFVADRVVHVGKHEVLPDEQAEFIAQPIEEIAFVSHRPADTQQVGPGIACERQIVTQRFLGTVQCEDV